MHVWRESGSRGVSQLDGGWPFAASHVNEPFLCQSQGEVIRGTAREEAQLRGTELTIGSFHRSPALHFVGTTARFGGEQKGTGRGASGLLIV